MAFIALCAALWVIFHLGAGGVAHRMSARSLRRLPFVNRTYAWEDEGRVYRVLAIQRWKDLLPEAGNFYPGGFPKQHLAAKDPLYLERFVLETTRAEFSHWLTWGLALTFLAWTPWTVTAVMIAYGAAANLPCILVQRYNRPRFARTLAASVRASHRNRPALPAHAVHDQGQEQ